MIAKLIALALLVSLSAPPVKIAAGPVASVHFHHRGLLRTYHIIIADDATARYYTCSVPRAEYDSVLYGGWDAYGYACLGVLGRK